MVLFAVAFVVALLGLGAFDLYNPGTRSITMAGYHFVAVPGWVPVALGAAVPLSLFLLHALWTSLRIWLLKGAVRRARAWDDPAEWPPIPPARWPEAPPTRQPAVPPARWPGDQPVERRQEVERPTRRLPRRFAERLNVDAPLPFTRRRRASQGPSPQVGPQPAPKRSWLNPRD
jgi:hypothetical protein